MNNKEPRKFKGFGVVTRQGLFLWQYTRPTEAETLKAYQTHNPQVEGHQDGFKIVSIALYFQD